MGLDPLGAGRAHVLPIDELFVDRIEESEALRRSLAAHVGRVQADEIDGQRHRNVLVFYGQGGMGKTELSRRLASWLMGRLRNDIPWGPVPEPTASSVGRWELNDSQGSVDLVDLLLELRRSYGEVRHEWPAFDLAFTAYARSLRPGHNLELTRSTKERAGFTVTDVLMGALSDAATVVDVAGAGLAGIGVAAVRSYASRRHRTAKAKRVFEAHPHLEPLVQRCEALSGSPHESLELAVEIAYTLSLEIDALPSAKRPIVVMFVDHFERVQGKEAASRGERAINGLVFALPYTLFVITGRNLLRWHEAERTHLMNSGAAHWPNLTLTQVAEEPRQHNLGHLSPSDAANLLTSGLQRLHLDVEPGLIDELVRDTGGWPLHLDTILDVARGRPRTGRPLTSDDLAGPLPSLVDRLFEDLPTEEAEALRAACLLPYFEPELAATAANVSVGATERLCHRSVVKSNPGSSYPFRIHDEIRRVVRTAGAQAHAGWADQDWADAAKRAVDEARTRFDRQVEAEDDVRAVDSLALLLNVAFENGIFPPGIVADLAKSPTLRGLSDRIPVVLPHAADPELVGVADFVRIMATEVSDDKLAKLRELAGRDLDISTRARLWLAYGHRQLGQFEIARAELERLLAEHPDGAALYRYQICSTLTQARQFPQALGLLGELTDVQQGSLVTSVLSHHGRWEGRAAAIGARLDTKRSSRRFALELRAARLMALHRTVGVSDDVVTEHVAQAQAVDQRVALITLASIQGQRNLFKDSWGESLEVLEDLVRLRRVMSLHLPLLLAMRGWVTGDESLIERAQRLTDAEPRRSAGWIAVEVLLRELGHEPSLTPDTLWIEPYESVHANWMQVHEGIVERARRDR